MSCYMLERGNVSVKVGMCMGLNLRGEPRRMLSSSGFLLPLKDPNWTLVQVLNSYSEPNIAEDSLI